MDVVGAGLTEGVTLRTLVPEGGAVSGSGPLRMEELGAFYGFMLYEVPLPAASRGKVGARNLTIVGGARDRVTAIVGGRTVGSVWRGDIKGCAENVSLLLPPADPSGVANETDQPLQLLVEVTGRLACKFTSKPPLLVSSELTQFWVNFDRLRAFPDGIQMQYDALIGKGLAGGAVMLDSTPLAGPWKHWALPLDSEQLQRWPTARPVNSSGSGSARPAGGTLLAPQLFEGVFEIGADEEPADCWAQFRRESGWRKGQLYVNGFFLGRMWATKGPRTSLFIPGPRLRKGRNVLRVVELEPSAAMVAAGAALELRDSA